VSRTDADSWDVASSVGATATMVAAARARASNEPNPMIVDPFAAPLVRAVGVDFFTKLADGEISLTEGAASTAALMTTVMAVRTKFFDDFFLTATGGGNSTTATGGGNSTTATGGGNSTTAESDGVRQAVILASGLDSRPYRLPWPDGTVVYEIDQPKVIEFKTATMTDIGATPTAERRTVAIDLREDWPAALRRSGFDESKPTAWSAEGLLVYLPPQAQDRLFDHITALSAPGSQLATEFHPDAGASIGERAATLRSEWQQHGFDVNLADLFYEGERNPVVEYLTGHGWQVCARTRPEVFAAYGKEFPDTDEVAPLRNSLAVIATRK
jgi:methyltransferase (TIGR00027 family)